MECKYKVASNGNNKVLVPQNVLIYLPPLLLAHSNDEEQCLFTGAGTFFYLLEDTAHPCLSISEDGFTIFYGDEELPISAMALDDNTFTR